MSTYVDRTTLPSIDDLPIPADATHDASWPEMMLDMAAHIGAYDTLRLIDRFGGQIIYVPQDPARSPFRDLLDNEAIAKLAWVYGRQDISFPVARRQLNHVRRKAVLDMVKRGELPTRDAAVILRTSRNYLSFLLQQVYADGPIETPEVLLALRRKKVADPRQITIFDHLDGQNSAKE